MINKLIMFIVNTGLLTRCVTAGSPRFLLLNVTLSSVCAVMSLVSVLHPSTLSRDTTHADGSRSSFGRTHSFTFASTSCSVVASALIVLAFYFSLRRLHRSILQLAPRHAQRAQKHTRRELRYRGLLAHDADLPGDLVVRRRVPGECPPFAS